MKTSIFKKSFLIILGFMFCCLFWSCEKDNSNFVDNNIQMRGHKPNHNPGGGGNNNGGNEDPVTIYRVKYLGDVAYDGAGNAVFDPNATQTLLNIDTIFAFVEKNTGKATVIKAVSCDVISSARVKGHSFLDNPCVSDTMCGALGIRQYDKKMDSQKVFAHFGIHQGRISMRGFIQYQTPGSETIIPANPGDTVFIALDQIRVNKQSPTDPCGTDYLYFNESNGNQLGDVGPNRVTVANQIPDQSLIIINTGLVNFDPCPGISCGYPGF